MFDMSNTVHEEVSERQFQQENKIMAVSNLQITSTQPQTMVPEVRKSSRLFLAAHKETFIPPIHEFVLSSPSPHPHSNTLTLSSPPPTPCFLFSLMLLNLLHSIIDLLMLIEELNGVFVLPQLDL